MARSSRCPMATKSPQAQCPCLLVSSVHTLEVRFFRDSESTPLSDSVATAGMKMPMKTMAAATNRARFPLEIDVPASKETNMRLC
jgi:hypothetical protein